MDDSVSIGINVDKLSICFSQDQCDYDNFREPKDNNHMYCNNLWSNCIVVTNISVNLYQHNYM